MPLVAAPILLPDGANIERAFNRFLPITVANPQPSGFNIKVPTGYNVIVQSCSVSVSTDATVANRFAGIATFDSNGDQIWRAGAPAVQVANQTITYYFGIDAEQTNLNPLFMSSSLPSIPVPTGGKISITLTGAVGSDIILFNNCYASWFPIEGTDGEPGQQTQTPLPTPLLI